MKIIKKHIDNYWANNNPRSIVLHTTGGYGFIGAYETLKARGLSYGYIIEPDGKVYELVHWSNSAWHAGVIKRPNLRAKAFYGTLKGKDNPNRNSVGIAFTYPDGIDILTDKQVDSATLLIKQIGKEAGVRYNADNVFYHKEVTYNKPAIVKGYRDQVLEALIGDKDHKDALQKTILQLTLQMLKLKLALLMRAFTGKHYA